MRTSSGTRSAGTGIYPEVSVINQDFSLYLVSHLVMQSVVSVLKAVVEEHFVQCYTERVDEGEVHTEELLLF